MQSDNAIGVARERFTALDPESLFSLFQGYIDSLPYLGDIAGKLGAFEIYDLLSVRVQRAGIMIVVIVW